MTYHRDYYARNRATITANRRKRDGQLRRQMAEYSREVKAAAGCKVCREADPVVLDFDHRDPKTKKFNVGSMYGKVSWDSLYEEMAKCDVLCANCHRRKTYASEV